MACLSPRSGVSSTQEAPPLLLRRTRALFLTSDPPHPQLHSPLRPIPSHARAWQNPVLYNLLLPLLIEPAPLLLGPLSSAIKAPATLWTGIAAICLALEAQGVVNDGSVNVPLLIPVVLFGGLGQLAAGNVGLPDVSSVPSPSFSAPSAPSLPSASFSAPALALPSFSAPVPQGGGAVQTVSFDASGKRGGGGNKGLRI